jgi:hypothetical protein
MVGSCHVGSAESLHSGQERQEEVGNLSNRTVREQCRQYYL